MQRQIDYHLARSRATASSGAAPGLRCSVLPSVEGLVRTMRRLYADRELTIDVDVSPRHEIRGRREDLDEMLGNLIDNACKWARSRVAVSSSIEDADLVIAVDDDGPGLDPSLRAQVLQRGVRVDQRVQGSGLGLAIVSELAELYGGSVALETSPLGGTRARLQLPRP
jgi:signal transduction histidine kinase